MKNIILEDDYIGMDATREFFESRGVMLPKDTWFQFIDEEGQPRNCCACSAKGDHCGNCYRPCGACQSRKECIV